jgi:B-box zinc finger
MNDPAILHCVNHPNRETSLRCNRCERPICPACAVRTPTGYRCKDCVRTQQKIFETALWWDYPLAFVVAGVLSFLGSLIVPFVGFFTIFLAPIAGVIIAEAVRLVIGRRRGRKLFLLTAAAVVLGSLPILGITVLSLLLFAGQGGFNLSAVLSIVYRGIYTVMVTSAFYYRLAGIGIKM